MGCKTVVSTAQPKLTGECMPCDLAVLQVPFAKRSCSHTRNSAVLEQQHSRQVRQARAPPPPQVSTGLDPWCWGIAIAEQIVSAGHTAPGQVQHPWQQPRQPPPLQQQQQQQAAAASSANNGFKIRPQGVGTYAPKFVSAKQRLAAAAMSKPAYISISLAKQAVHQAAKPAQDEAKGAAAWPDSLRSFVARMFAACKTEDDRTKTQEVLKKMIKDAQDAGEMWTRDWDALSNGEPATASASAPQPTYRSVSTAYSPVANHRCLILSGHFCGRLLCRPLCLSLLSYRPYSRQMPTPGRGRKAKRARSPSPSISRSSDSTYSSSPPRRSASEERRLARRANRFGNGAAMGSTQLHYGRTPVRSAPHADLS